jgi:hypothetical protein
MLKTKSFIFACGGSKPISFAPNLKIHMLTTLGLGGRTLFG